jgi:CHAT domain-containing protein/tetratricopeptide (TPR) repeat protein
MPHGRGGRAALVLLAALAAGGAGIAGAPNAARAQAAGAPGHGEELAEAERLYARGTELYKAGKYAEARPHFRRALAIREKALGPDHPDVATSLNNLAMLLQAKGDYAGAEPLYRRTLAVREKALGPDHPDVAQSLNNLAELLQAKGDYAGAEPLLRRALTIREKALGSDHPAVATSLGNLATLLQAKGDNASAEPLYRRALAISEKALGPDHPWVATSLGTLAMLLQAKGDNAGAEPLYRRALAISEKALGPDHPDVAIRLNNLALLLQLEGDYTGAEPRYRRALAISEKLGPDHRDVATSLNNLASLLQLKGDYAGAEPLFRGALAIHEKALGPDHPDVAVSLSSLASLLWAKGDYAGTLPLLARGLAIEDTQAGALLATGSDRQKQAFFATLSGSTSWALSFHLQTQPKSPAARDLALRTLLRRKGLTLDAGADMLRALAASAAPEDRARLELLAVTRGELGTLAFRGPGSKEPPEAFAGRVRSLEGEADELERQLAARYAELRVARQLVTMEAVQGVIPAGAALVEIAQYRPFDPRAKPSDRFGKSRYAAYVLTPQGAPRSVDLGPAEPIDTLVESFRAALSSDAPDAATRGRALDDAVMRPIRALLGDTRDVLLSPDGALNLVPFAALVDETGHFLLERYRFTYLTSGRDLLRFANRTAPRSPPLVLGAPDYGPMAPAATSESRGVSPVDLAKIRFPPLPGARAEATAIAPLIADARLLEGAAATEAAVKAVHGPSVVHLATHGFFLAPTDADQRAATRGLVLEPTNDRASAGPLPTNPLLRSGLAFAGANTRSGGGDDDGILTGLEAAALDLRGTQLVVLSACETGVGDVKTGDGVYGLRRALVLAGSESQVMSLWKVDDEATRTLMADYYRRVEAAAAAATRSARRSWRCSASRAPRIRTSGRRFSQRGRRRRSTARRHRRCG